MGVYDCFVGKEEEVNSAQLKTFDCKLKDYKVGDQVPVLKYGYPKSCTFCEWGGNPDTPFKGINVLGLETLMGIFVIIKDGQLWDVNENIDDIIYPVYDKYGDLLAKEPKRTE